MDAATRSSDLTTHHREDVGPPPRAFVSLLMAAFVLMALPASAQFNAGEIAGVVTDGQGGVLPGALVIAEHAESGQKIDRITDGSGRFLLPGLRAGAYLLSVELSGFKRAVQRGIVVQVGQRIDLNVILEVGGLTEAVVVTGVAPILQTANAEVAQIVRNEQVVQLPLNGRNGSSSRSSPTMSWCRQAGRVARRSSRQAPCSTWPASGAVTTFTCWTASR